MRDEGQLHPYIGFVANTRYMGVCFFLPSYVWRNILLRRTYRHSLIRKVGSFRKTNKPLLCCKRTLPLFRQSPRKGRGGTVSIAPLMSTIPPQTVAFGGIADTLPPSAPHSWGERVQKGNFVCKVCPFLSFNLKGQRLPLTRRFF